MRNLERYVDKSESENVVLSSKLGGKIKRGAYKYVSNENSSKTIVILKINAIHSKKKIAEITHFISIINHFYKYEYFIFRPIFM